MSATPADFSFYGDQEERIAQPKGTPMADRSTPTNAETADDFAYRFEYADKSAFEVLADGQAFIVFPNGRREQKFGKITNNIPLLMGRVAKPRQDAIASLQSRLSAQDKRVEELEKALTAAREQFRHIILGTDMRAGNGDGWANGEAAKGFKACDTALTDGAADE